MSDKERAARAAETEAAARLGALTASQAARIRRDADPDSGFYPGELRTFFDDVRNELKAHDVGNDCAALLERLRLLVRARALVDDVNAATDRLSR